MHKLYHYISWCPISLINIDDLQYLWVLEFEYAYFGSIVMNIVF